MDYTVSENAVMACIKASKKAAERDSADDADEAFRYAETARTLAEAMAIAFRYNIQ